VVPKEGELADKLQKKTIETQVIPLPALRPWFFIKIISSLGKFFTICKFYRPALIYANGSRAAFYGGIVGRILSLPVVWHCRIADPDKYLDILLARLCNHIVVNSQATARRFGAHFQPKLTVIYNGLDLQWSKDNRIKKPAQIKDEWEVILVVARISKWKRHDLALSAFEKVAKSYPKAHLVCLGAKDRSEPEWWDNLQDMSYRSVFSDRIHWIGHVDDVRPWYRVAQVLVLPSINEPFGRVLVEAMSCGVPVIATNSGGVPEIVRHSQDGLLVAPEKDDAIAEALMEMLTDDALREGFGQSARERSESFSLDTHIAKMLYVFQDIIKDES
jgi:glycosyltransferase involved in cell wall biosynthesis